MRGHWPRCSSRHAGDVVQFFFLKGTPHIWHKRRREIFFCSLRARALSALIGFRSPSSMQTSTQDGAVFRQRMMPQGATARSPGSVGHALSRGPCWILAFVGEHTTAPVSPDPNRAAHSDAHTRMGARRMHAATGTCTHTIRHRRTAPVRPSTAATALAAVSSTAPAAVFRARGGRVVALDDGEGLV